MRAPLLCLLLLFGAQLSFASHSTDVSDTTEIHPFKNSRILDYCQTTCTYTGSLIGQTDFTYTGYFYDYAEVWFEIRVGTAKKEIILFGSSTYSLSVESYLKAGDGSVTQLLPTQNGTAAYYGRLMIPSSRDSGRNILIKLRNGYHGYNSGWCTSSGYACYQNYANLQLNVVSSEEQADLEESESGLKGWVIPVIVGLSVLIVVLIVGCICIKTRRARNLRRQRPAQNRTPASPNRNIATVYQVVDQQPSQNYPQQPQQIYSPQRYPQLDFPYPPQQYMPASQASYPGYLVPTYQQPAAPVQVTVHNGLQNEQSQPLQFAPSAAQIMGQVNPQIIATYPPNRYPYLPPINNGVHGGIQYR